jgi:hypothetical protein
MPDRVGRAAAGLRFAGFEPLAEVIGQAIGLAPEGKAKDWLRDLVFGERACSAESQP